MGNNNNGSPDGNPGKRRGRPPRLGALDRQRILNDAAFEGTRQSMVEFGIASKVASLLRNCLLSRAQNFMDGQFYSRLRSRLMEFLRQCPNEPEERLLAFGQHIASLHGFPLRSGVLLQDWLRTTFVLSLDKKGLQLRFSPFSAQDLFPMPGATHWRLILLGKPIHIHSSGNVALEQVIVDPMVDYQRYELSVFAMDEEINGIPPMQLRDLHPTKQGPRPDWVVGIGIEYLKAIGSSQRLLADGACMEMFVIKREK